MAVHYNVRIWRYHGKTNKIVDDVELESHNFHLFCEAQALRPGAHISISPYCDDSVSNAPELFQDTFTNIPGMQNHAAVPKDRLSLRPQKSMRIGDQPNFNAVDAHHPMCVKLSLCSSLNGNFLLGFSVENAHYGDECNDRNEK